MDAGREPRLPAAAARRRTIPVPSHPLGLAAGIICKRHANRTRSNRTTTVWACLPNWQRDGATRVYRNRPRALQARDTATFLPTDERQPDADGEAGHHPSTET